MLINNYTDFKLAVVTFVGKQTSVSHCVVPSRHAVKAPRILIPQLGDYYETVGSLHVRAPGYVLGSSNSSEDLIIFKGGRQSFARQCRLFGLHHLREGCLVMAEADVDQFYC